MRSLIVNNKTLWKFNHLERTSKSNPWHTYIHTLLPRCAPKAPPSTTKRSRNGDIPSRTRKFAKSTSERFCALHVNRREPLVPTSRTGRRRCPQRTPADTIGNTTSSVDSTVPKQNKMRSETCSKNSVCASRISETSNYFKLDPLILM